MHTSPENLGDSEIEIFKRQTAYVRCACGTDQNWKDNQEIFDNWKHLHNLSEAMRIDSAFTGDMKCWHYNTTAMLFSLFDVMFHRWEDVVFIDLHTMHKCFIHMLPVVSHYYSKIQWNFTKYQIDQ